ncbi:MAG: hypothetical protein R2796_05755 [Chitinophagaceae bacterium]|nr:hypothetical protein [Chitinophagaceae bacterium]
MEEIVVPEDIKILYITAKSFPEGIQEATNELHRIVPFSADRKYFGVSRPENGGAIVYRAGTEELENGEAEKLNCDTLVLKKGKYIGLTVNDFRKDVLQIGKAFEELLKQPNLDPQGYCVEWYATDQESVKCMIRLKQ